MGTAPRPRRGPSITWTIENFEHWCLLGGEEDLDSGEFGLADETQWRMRVVRSTMELWLVRTDEDSGGPGRPRIGFEFGVVATDDPQLVIYLAEPRIHHFERGWSVGSGGWLDVETILGIGRWKYLHPGRTLVLRCRMWRARNAPPAARVTLTKNVSTAHCTNEAHCKVFPKEEPASSSFSNHEPKSGSSGVGTRKPTSEKFTLSYDISKHDAEDADKGFYITLYHDNAKPLMTQSRFAILDNRGRPTQWHSERLWHHFVAPGHREGWETPWAMEWDSLQQRHLLSDEGQRIHLSLELDYAGGDYTDEVTGDTMKSTARRKRTGSSLSADMRRFFGDFGDCPGDMRLISGDGECVRAHSSLLCARSPVFLAMMERDMEEKRSRTVRIPDMDGATLRRMLGYLYGGMVEESLSCTDALAFLYVAGDKYGVLSLKERCSSLLGAGVTPSNACDILGFSELYCDRGMRGRALSVLSEKAEEVLISEEWREVEEGLAEEVLVEMVERRRRRIKLI